MEDDLDNRVVEEQKFITGFENTVDWDMWRDSLAQDMWNEYLRI